MKPFDIANTSNADYLEQLYRQYLQDPKSVDPQWYAYFAGFDLALTRPHGVPKADAAVETAVGATSAVQDLVHTYRELGHFEAKLDPLGSVRPAHPSLNIEEFGFTEADLDKQVGTGGFAGKTDGTLRDLIAKLRATYCQSIGVEFLGISDKAQRDWLIAAMEPTLNKPVFTKEESRALLFQLVESEDFERFLHTRYVGKKRFSLEGAESLNPIINTIIDESSPFHVENFLLGMAHRGRLNVLAHVLKKPYEFILSEFEGTNKSDVYEGDGDVKYHLGFSNTRKLKDGREIKMTLASNPSHLEFVNSVIGGMVRCKQAYYNDEERTRVVPILIHGDAAFVGQGVVHETLCLSELANYRTGGTIHVIVNNQIGFTTPPEQARFTPYPTDVAKNIQAPVFHVNGDDMEACIHAARLAIAFRERFKCDVMIDQWCYRKYGHNETDEPAYTQPVMYQKIKEHFSTREIYSRQLLERGFVTNADLEEMKKTVLDKLEKAQVEAKEVKNRRRLPSMGGTWKGMKLKADDWAAKTQVAGETLRNIVDACAKVPAGFTLHPKLLKHYAERADAVKNGKGIDWATGEMLGLGTLLQEGHPIRFSGQDVPRGTFTHRQAVLHDFKTGTEYTPLNNLSPKQAKSDIFNSMLSEVACLGFEYGYSSADPRNLVIWEAQFGDFVNGAQPIIDQFICAAESKWQQSNGLVMMLPHGYEGAGPEHSSAYLERFLSLCAQDNIQVVTPTLPSQVFHALRRQLLRQFRKPLVLLMPKAMLRMKETFSTLDEFTERPFQLVIDDPLIPDKSRVTRLLLCCGKVYYTIAAAREKNKQADVSVIRIEQPYPLPVKEIQAAIAKYPNVKEICWLQEETQNRGAYAFMYRKAREFLPAGFHLDYIGRDEAASPAVGSEYAHQHEEKAFVTAALDTAPKSAERRAAVAHK